MNFRQKLTLYFLLYIGLSSAVFAQPVHIPDPNLRAAVREALNIPDRPDVELTQPFMRQNLTSLRAPSRQINNLEGLQYATNVTYLRLHGNSITDLRPLAALTRLTKLLLGENDITDVTPLANLTSLKHLELQNNRITDITPLDSLANLEYIDTHNNPIFDPDSPIVDIPDPNLRAVIRETLKLSDGVPINRAFMRQLTELNAGNRDISDLTGLEHATSLTSLALHGNDISDLSPLSPFVNLTFLRIHHNQINDISPLTNLAKLTTLLLDGNNITDINPLTNLTQLTTLILSWNDIMDISALGNLTGLMRLVLSNNDIMDVTPLANLASLKHLELQNNRIADITSLEILTSLEHLDTQNNPIFDPDSPLVDIPDLNLRAAVTEVLHLPAAALITQADMLRLTHLDVSKRGISNLNGLEYATHLEGLAVYDNQIADLTPLAELRKLEGLAMWANLIVDLSPLANLTKLHTIDAAGNLISNISPLTSLTQLKHLILRHNFIIDVQPLASLHNLERLEIQNNLIADHSPLDALQLTHFRYDQSCDIPSLPLEPRLENRFFPSVFAAWVTSIENRPHLSSIESISRHDLWFGSGISHERLFYMGNDWHVRGDIGKAEQKRNDYLALNPNIVILAQIQFRATLLSEYPEDWPYWLRNAQGEIVRAGGEHLSPPVHDGFIDFTHPGFQDRIVSQAVAISKCGLYDGIMIDWWNDNRALLVSYNPYIEYRGYEVEMQAKINIMERIREETRPNFLIIGNVNRDKLPRTGQYVNGGFMETLVPSDRHRKGIEEGLAEIESTLLWLEKNLREPQINCLEGWSVPTEPPDSLTNLRWMRTFTTLSLTHSDGYVLFQTGGGHHHYWYEFWDADLGGPVEEMAQLYQETEGLYIREFTNGWAVYNRSGDTQEITLPELVTGVASGMEGTTHTLPNLDGEIYLRAKPTNPADVNGDGVVNIFDLTLVAQAFGTDKGEADVNGDGVVNVFDVVFVAREMQ